ncbi:uncharacterized protein LOC110984993 [Acanthaster planci]|uniref:Uncharacterized protein LOC110984993 n=1 Tax=Acanthaster planci TaxID=133434 RepID=A0A8B7Z6T7_ACAPL|nr:uncharacterized protein LOC110984993 [Acanthaster planci]
MMEGSRAFASCADLTNRFPDMENVEFKASFVFKGYKHKYEVREEGRSRLQRAGRALTKPLLSLLTDPKPRHTLRAHGRPGVSPPPVPQRGQSLDVNGDVVARRAPQDPLPLPPVHEAPNTNPGQSFADEIPTRSRSHNEIEGVPLASGTSTVESTTPPPVPPRDHRLRFYTQREKARDHTDTKAMTVPLPQASITETRAVFPAEISPCLHSHHGNNEPVCRPRTTRANDFESTTQGSCGRKQIPGPPSPSQAHVSRHTCDHDNIKHGGYTYGMCFPEELQSQPEAVRGYSSSDEDLYAKESDETYDKMKQLRALQRQRAPVPSLSADLLGTQSAEDEISSDEQYAISSCPPGKQWQTISVQQLTGVPIFYV